MPRQSGSYRTALVGDENTESHSNLNLSPAERIQSGSFLSRHFAMCSELFRIQEVEPYGLLDAAGRSILTGPTIYSVSNSLRQPSAGKIIDGNPACLASSTVFPRGSSQSDGHT